MKAQVFYTMGLNCDRFRGRGLGRAMAIALIGAVSAVGLAACGAAPSSTTSKIGTIPVGFLSETSGSYVDWGVPALAAAQWQVQRVNESGGITIGGKRYDLRLVVLNDGSDPAQAAALARELIQTDHVKIITGAIGNIAPVVLPIAERAHVLFMSSASAAAPLLPTDPYFVLTLPSATTQAEVVLHAVKLLLPSAKTVAFFGPENDTTTSNVAAMSALLTQYGLRSVGVTTVSPTTTDYTSAFLHIKGERPDVLFTFPLGPAGQEQEIQTNNSVKAAPVIFSHGVPCSVPSSSLPQFTYYGNPAVGAVLAPPSNAAVAAYVSAVTPKVGSQYASNLYTGLWESDFIGLLAQAIRKAQTATNPLKIITAMKTVSYSGINGVVRITSGRSASYGLEICGVSSTGTVSERHVAPAK